MKTLRPHQTKAIDQLRQSLRSGKRRPVLRLPTGAGKTLIAAKIIDNAIAKGKRILFVVDAVELIDQTVNALYAEGLHGIGVIQADHPMTDSSKPIQVASVQTLARRDCPAFDLCIIDECFPAGTMVSTPGGDKPIESIQRGDIVHTATGVGVVENRSAKSVSALVKVNFDDGTSIRATGNHPFFTKCGWVEARDLAGKSVCRREGLRGLWGIDEAEILPQRPGDVSGSRIRVEEKEFLRQILRAEILESNGIRGYTRKDGRYIAENWSQANLEGWKWQAANSSAATSLGCPRRGLDRRVLGGDAGSNDGFAISDVLQAGCSESIRKNLRRDRRNKPQREAEVDRREEGRLSSWARVESVQVEKLGSPNPVFNLHVGSHPSYFANGNLVHNCHTLYKAHHALVEGSAAPFIGLSATPWAKGMGLVFDDLIQPASIAELTDLGYVARLEAYAPGHPDLTGVKVRAGEYDDTALSQVMRGEKLVADVVQTWSHMGMNRPTLCFCVDLAHAETMRERFERAAIPAAFISGDTPVIERKAIRRQLDAGEIMVVCSVGTMIKGVDWKFGTIVDAQPTKSRMRHVQKLGRLRPFPEWPTAIVLDHSDNILRLGLPIDIRCDTLDCSKKGEAQQSQAEAASIPKGCPRCSAVKPAGVKQCPACGFENKRHSDMEEAAGSLVLVDGEKKGPKKLEPTMADKQRFFSELKHVALARKRSDGWVNHSYRDRFKVWPNGLSHATLQPSPETLAWVRAKDIRWVKGRGKRQASTR